MSQYGPICPLGIFYWVQPARYDFVSGDDGDTLNISKGIRRLLMPIRNDLKWNSAFSRWSSGSTFYYKVKTLDFTGRTIPTRDGFMVQEQGNDGASARYTILHFRWGRRGICSLRVIQPGKRHYIQSICLYQSQLVHLFCANDFAQSCQQLSQRFWEQAQLVLRR